MKNKLSGFVKIVTVLSACLLFASFSPSLDGRAVVVDEGVFPQGLFAKTVGYLPGDIISVASISTDTTVDLLVIGALDPSEGVAIMLSPEAASAIGIEKSANNIVKITKRSGQDDRVYGTAVIAKNNGTTEFTAEEAEEFDSTIATESEENFDETEATDFDEFEEEETIEEETEVPEENEDFVEETPVEEEAVEEETPAEIEEPLEEEQIEETPAALEEETEVEEEVPEYETITAEEEEPEVEEEAPVEEDVEETPEEDVEAEPFEEEELAQPEEEIESEAVEADELENLPEEETIEEAPVEEAPVEEISEEEAEESEEDDIVDEIMEEELEEFEQAEEEYEAIVLVPTDSNPPEEETEVVEETEEVEDIEDVEEVSEVEEVTEAVEEITEDVPDVIEETPAPVVNAPKSYKKYMVGSLSDLKSGAYYIQIAALSNDENILEIIGKYAKNYPITIVPMAGGIRKQVMIGPLNMDEYAVVLERFKSYGYKDAFLRKIK